MVFNYKVENMGSLSVFVHKVSLFTIFLALIPGILALQPLPGGVFGVSAGTSPGILARTAVAQPVVDHPRPVVLSAATVIMKYIVLNSVRTPILSLMASLYLSKRVCTPGKRPTLPLGSPLGEPPGRPYGGCP